MMKKLKHGGNIRQMAERYQIPRSQWLDLSTGINPYHYPVDDIPASYFHYLPDNQDDLLQAAREFYQCQSILACNGSQQAIQIMPRLLAPVRVALPNCGYQEHAYRWQLAGHTPCWYDGYQPESIERLIIEEGVEAAVIINPNNPTAATISVAKILQWAAIMAERGGLLIIDEAFIDLTPELSVSQYAERPGLVVLRSVGKFFGLAGIRLGFVLAAPSLLKCVDRELSPWQVNGPAECLMIRALRDRAWQCRNRTAIDASREQLLALLRQHINQPIADGGLFLSINTDHRSATVLHERLAKHGIAVRFGIYDENNAFIRFGLLRQEDNVSFERLRLALEI